MLRFDTRVVVTETEDVWVSIFTIHCDGDEGVDDCNASLPRRKSQAMADLVAVEAGWAVNIPIRKFTGVVRQDFCPKCRKVSPDAPR